MKLEIAYVTENEVWTLNSKRPLERPTPPPSNNTQRNTFVRCLCLSPKYQNMSSPGALLSEAGITVPGSGSFGGDGPREERRVKVVASQKRNQSPTESPSNSFTKSNKAKGPHRGERRRSLAGAMVAIATGATSGSSSSTPSTPSPQMASRRRAMPVQGGQASRRREVHGNLEPEDDTLAVIVSGLWKNHRLLPPSSMSPNKVVWDMFVIVLVLINCYMTPLELCFRSFQEYVETPGGIAFRVADHIIDFFFFVDIVINFRTTYFDDDGELVVDYKLLARTYMWRPPYWFWMDLVGTIPWDLLNPLLEGNDGATRAARLLKLPRLLRLGRLMKNLDQLRSGNIVRITRLLIYFNLVSHWLACIWWLLGESSFNTNASFGTPWTVRGMDACEGCTCQPLDGPNMPYTASYEHRAVIALQDHINRQVPGYHNATEWQRTVLDTLSRHWRYAWCDPDPMDPHSELQPSRSLLINGDFTQQYMSSLYWGLTMVMKTAYIGPDTAYEKLVAAIMVIFGSLVYIIVLASVVSMLTAYSRSTAVHRDHRETVSNFCHAHELSGRLRRRWFAYIQEEWRLFKGVSTGDVLRSFPYHLRASTIQSIHQAAVANCPMFNNLSEEAVKFLLQFAKHEVILPKYQLLKEGIQTNRLYILIRGVLQCSHSAQMEKVRKTMLERQTKKYARQTTQGNLSSDRSPSSSFSFRRGRKTSYRHRSEEDEESSGLDPRLRSSAAWKRALRESVVVERPGAMLGFADAYTTAKESVYTAATLTTVEVLAFDRHTLAHGLSKCREDDVLSVCSSIEKEYNKLMMQLKSGVQSDSSASLRDSVSIMNESAAEVESPEDLRRRVLGWMGDFKNPDHVKYLEKRCTNMENKLEAACVDAAKVRYILEAYTKPIAQVIFNAYGSKYGNGRNLTPRGLHVHMRRGGVGNTFAKGRAPGLFTPALPGLAALQEAEPELLAEDSQGPEASQRELFAAAVLREEHAGENAYEKVLRERERDAAATSNTASRSRNDFMRQDTRARNRNVGRDFMQQENTAAMASAMM